MTFQSEGSAVCYNHHALIESKLLQRSKHFCGTACGKAFSAVGRRNAGEEVVTGIVAFREHYARGSSACFSSP